MHAARHRALRELGAMARQMADHWESLARRVGGPPAAERSLREGAGAARAALSELRPLAAARGVRIGAAALGAGRLARARAPLPDAVLERNQALRLALLDAEHLLTLIDYVGALSSSEGDAELADAAGRWATSVRAPARGARRAAVALGRQPDLAVEPLSRAQKLTYALGWLGEAVDRRASAAHRSPSRAGDPAGGAPT